MFVVSVVCTAHTCSVCPCTTCVHISVPFQGGWCCLSCCRTLLDTLESLQPKCSVKAGRATRTCSRHGQQGTKMVDHEATCRLGSGDMGPLNVELLHKLFVCVMCFVAIVFVCDSIVITTHSPPSLFSYSALNSRPTTAGRL